MKTKVLLLLCLFLGIGLTQLYAQIPTPKNGKTGSVSFKWNWIQSGTNDSKLDYYMDIPVNCDKNDVDRLFGTVTVHNINHSQMENLVWVNQQIYGEVTSEKTGEKFKVKDILRWEAVEPDIAIGHVNLIGDNGSHYILTYIFDFSTGNIIFDKAVCN